MLRRVTRRKAVAPPRGRVLSIDVPVPCATSWHDGLLAGAPETDQAGNEWNAGKFFLPHTPPASKRLILMWAGKKSSMSPYGAILWAAEYGLPATHPLEVLALSAAYPHLYRDLKLDGVGLVPTELRDFRHNLYVCGVWQSAKHQNRRAMLRPAYESLHDRTVFVFGYP